MTEKQALRKQYHGLLKNQSAHDRERKSALIAKQLERHPAFVQARLVMFYAALAHEVDTFGMIRKAFDHGKRVCLPVVEKSQKRIIPVLINHLDELTVASYGIKEPACRPEQKVDITLIDLVIVPGVAFDSRNHRLGHGIGFYDRFLSNLPATIPTIGLAFDFQLTDCLPTETHDVALSCVLAA